MSVKKTHSCISLRMQLLPTTKVYLLKVDFDFRHNILGLFTLFQLSLMFLDINLSLPQNLVTKEKIFCDATGTPQE